MVLYFSATGNTRYIAEHLAKLLHDTSLDLLPRIRRKDFSAIHSSKPFVLCAPTYVCEMPRFLADYLKNVPLTGSREVWFLFTSGGYTGCSGVLAEKLIRKKKMQFKGYAEFTMPGNYIADDHYPERGEEEIVRRISDASKKLPEVAETIRNGGVLKHRHVWLFEKLVTIPYNPVWCRFKQPTSPFFVGQSCISCGRCARLCPVNAITIVNGKPLWTKERCAHCMSCIQNCPVEAIEYGNITQGKKRYLFQKYRRCIPEGKQSGNMWLLITLLSLLFAGVVIALFGARFRDQYHQLFREMNLVSDRIETLVQELSPGLTLNLSREEETSAEDVIVELRNRFQALEEGLSLGIEHVRAQAYLDAPTGLENRTAYEN